jgi:hypothetical protein
MPAEFSLSRTGDFAGPPQRSEWSTSMKKDFGDDRSELSSEGLAYPKTATLRKGCPQK